MREVIVIHRETESPSGGWNVTTTSPGFNDLPFDADYDARVVAEEVAHAIAATLHGVGRSTLIRGCSCAGEHDHIP